MPKVTLGQYAKANEEFRRILKAGMVRQGKSRKEITTKTRTSEATYYNRLENPEDMTVRELRIYRRELKISDDELLSVL